MAKVFLVVSIERVQLEGLSEVFSNFKTSNLSQPFEVTVLIDLSSKDSVPLDSLKLQVGGIFLEFKVSDGFVEVNVGSLDGMGVFTSHLELVEVEVFWEDLHF